MGRGDRSGLGFASAVWRLAFDHSGRRLASGGQDGNVIVWDLNSGEARLRESVDGTVVHSVAFLDRGPRVLACSEGGTLALLELTGGAPRRVRLPGPGLSAVVVEDGKSLLAATHSGAIPTYELPGLTPLGLAAESQPGVTPHLGAIRLALDPDSRILAMGAFSGKKSVVLRDARTLTPLLLLKYQYIMVFNFGRSGANLAACGLERVVTLWNVALIRSELAPSGPEWVAPASASPRPPGPASDRGTIPSAETIEVPATPGVADKQWPALLRKAEAHLRRGRRAEADAGFETVLAVGQGDPSQYR